MTERQFEDFFLGTVSAGRKALAAYEERQRSSEQSVSLIPRGPSPWRPVVSGVGPACHADRPPLFLTLPLCPRAARQESPQSDATLALVTSKLQQRPPGSGADGNHPSQGGVSPTLATTPSSAATQPAGAAASQHDGATAADAATAGAGGSLDETPDKGFLSVLGTMKTTAEALKQATLTSHERLQMQEVGVVNSAWPRKGGLVPPRGSRWRCGPCPLAPCLAASHPPLLLCFPLTLQQMKQLMKILGHPE